MKSNDFCITFDTTGSMYPCLTQVRRNVQNLVNKLFSTFSDLRIAIIAHGDYCDGDRAISYLDFSENKSEICDFIQDVAPTHGGDSPECYELVLRTARTKLDWEVDREKTIMMIGDAVPHYVGYRYGTYRNEIDWEEEVDELLKNNTKIYAVHAMPEIRQHSKEFYQTIADKTNGFYLTLDQFSTIEDLIIGSCYRSHNDEEGLNKFITEVKSDRRMTRSLHQSFETLLGRDAKIVLKSEEIVREDGLIPVPAGRFQRMNVPNRVDKIPIREFAYNEGILFEAGRFFYELTKTEQVQQHKEIILVDTHTGDIFTGPQVRKMLNLPAQVSKDKARKENIKRLSSYTYNDKDLSKFKIFIQSTSHTRKLMEGTDVLYEVIDK